jgi:hypothetical protein
MLTISTLKTLVAQHPDDALVLVAIFTADGEGMVYEIVDWDANGQHLQLHVTPERRYKWGPPQS